MPAIIIVLILAVALFILKHRNFQNSDMNMNRSKNSNEDNLKKYFGEDYAKITGISSSADDFGNASPFYENPVQTFTPQKKSADIPSEISDILNRPQKTVSNTPLYGESPINDVINNKLSGAGFLGIRITVQNRKEMPVNAVKPLCDLASVMLAKGIGGCAKSNIKEVIFSVIPDENSMVITCIYPERAIAETDERIKTQTEALGGSLISETVDGLTTDKAVIPNSNALFNTKNTYF